MRAVPIGELIKAVVMRPRLWGEALRSIPALARRRWWRTPPYLPLPDPEYLSWRIATAYGSSSAPMVVEDVVAYLEWRRRQRLGVRRPSTGGRISR